MVWFFSIGFYKFFTNNLLLYHLKLKILSKKFKILLNERFSHVKTISTSIGKDVLICLIFDNDLSVPINVLKKYFILFAFFLRRTSIKFLRTSIKFISHPSWRDCEHDTNQRNLKSVEESLEIIWIADLWECWYNRDRKGSLHLILLFRHSKPWPVQDPPQISHVISLEASTRFLEKRTDWTCQEIRIEPP